MRKYRYLACVAAGAAILALPASAAFATSTHASAATSVLTIKKVGGPAVKRGAILTASLVKGTKVSFTIGTLASASCSTSSFTSVVVTNPSAPGTAALTVRKETLAGCKLIKTSIKGLKLKSVSPVNLPYFSTITSKRKVTVSEVSASKPLGFSAKVLFGTTPLTCIYTAKSVKGTASNATTTVAFSNQKFTLDAKKSSADCAAAATSIFSAVYGPVKDTSVKGSPKVYVS
jgi:hypothetical protein